MIILNIEKDIARENLKNANKALNTMNKTMTDLSKLMIDQANYSDTGQKNVKVTVSDGNTTSNKLQILTQQSLSNKISIDKDKDEKEDERDSYYNKAHIDYTSVSNATLDTLKQTYQKTDVGQGTRSLKRYSSLLGAGSISKSAAIADTKNRVYYRNQEQMEQLHLILGIKQENKLTGEIEERKNAKITVQDFVTDASHSTIIDDFNKNKAIINGYLQNRGINAERLTINDIDDMIGREGQASYKEKFFSTTHSGKSIIFSGQMRDKLDSKFDTLFHRNTGVTDSSSHHIVIDDNLRTILMEKRWQLQMQPKIDQIQRSPGGAKNLLNNWKQEVLRDTDVEEGIQNINSALTTIKTATVATESLVGITSAATVTMAEAAGRITANAGKGGSALAGKIYAGGNADKLSKWNVKASKFNANLDKLNQGSKVIGREGRKYIGAASKATISFTSKSTSSKVKIVSNKINNGAKWAVVNTAGRTKTGKKVIEKHKDFKEKTNDKINVFKGGISKFRNEIYNHTKIVRLPLTAINAITRTANKAKILICAALGIVFIIAVILLIIVSGIVSIIPSAFHADSSYAVSYKVGQDTINEMLIVQNNFLKEVEDYMNRTCILVDEEGNKLHDHHNAYFLKYMGDNSDYFENLSSSTVPLADTYTTNSGNTGSYNIATLYKTIISMATVATGNEAEDADFYKDYCCLLLNKILHTATFGDGIDGRIAIIVTDTGITDAMRLDPNELRPNWCNEYFSAVNDGWMHTYGVNSLEYSEWLRSEDNYNAWHGWNVEDMISYDWATTLWEMDAEDWGDLDVILPGSIGGGGNGSSFSPTTVTNTIEKLREDGYSELRIKAIEIALNEVGKHVYGVRSDSSNFPYTLDCSDFISGVLLEAGVPGAVDATTGGMVSLYPHLNAGDEVVPGTIMVKNNTSGSVVNGQVVSSNHVVMYIGAVEGYGDYCVVECSAKTTYKNGEKYLFVDGVSVSGFNTWEQLRSKYPYQYYLNPFGD